MSEQLQPPTHTGSGPFNYSLSQSQDLIDSTSSLKSRHHVDAAVYGWTPGTKGVWVLESPTDEQCARLEYSYENGNDNEPDSDTGNARLRDAGAAFYAVSSTVSYADSVRWIIPAIPVSSSVMNVQ